MRIVNTKSKELLEEQKQIRKYNNRLPEINEEIIELNNIKWMSSIFVTVPAIFVLLLFIPFKSTGLLLDILRYTSITALSITIGIALGTKIAALFYRPLQNAKHETESMHIAHLLNKYNPMAVAKKGNNYLLVLEDKVTKIIMNEVIMFKHIEKTNINEIILDVDNERLYIPYKR